MSTVRKIEGLALKGGPKKDTYIFHPDPNGAPMATEQRAVLIVSSDGPPPRYFTQEEVKALLREITATQYDYRESEAIVDVTSIERIAKKHGITDL